MNDSANGTATQVQSAFDRLKGDGPKLAATSLAPIETLTEKKLKLHSDAVAHWVEAATEDSQNFSLKSTDEFLAAVKAGLEAGVNATKSAIMAHRSFRALERAHATVEEQVFQQDGQGLRVRVMSTTLSDIRKDLADAGKVDNSQVYQSLVANEYHRPGGKPNRIVHLVDEIGPNEVDVLDAFLEMADEAHFALLTQAEPGVVCPNDEKTGDAPRDYAKLPRTPEGIEKEYGKLENASLHSRQQQPNATKWVYAVGQTIARRPYHPKTNPAPTAKSFTESNGPLYLPVSTLLAKSISRSYTRNRNGYQISGIFNGGKHIRPAIVQDGDVMTLDCVINDKQEAALHRSGLYCVTPWKSKDFAVAFDSVSAFVPVATGDEQEDADARVASRLAYTMLSIELGHMLKSALRYARGTTQDVRSMAELIENQMKLLVTPDARSATEEMLARKPLAAVSVRVESPAPGVFVGTAQITPHMVMSEVQVSLKLTAELSSLKK